MEIMRKISTLIILIAIIILAACKKQDSADVTERPVVIAYLTPGQPVTVKVYQQKGLADTASYGAAITGLSLSLSNGSQTVALTESGAGNYVYSNTSFIASGKSYTLKFSYLTGDVTATTTVPAKPKSYTASKTTINMPLVSNKPGATDSIAVTFKWSNPDSLYHVIVFKNDDNRQYQFGLVQTYADERGNRNGNTL